MQTDSPSYAGPWSLEFDRDGTEDVGVIVDADGEELARSRPFWLPEGADPTPLTLTAVRLMSAAPKLYRALEDLLDQTVETDREHGIPLSEGEEAARTQALAALTAASGRGKTHEVEVLIRTGNVYHVRAADAEEARERWWWGDLVAIRDDDLELEVQSVKEVEP
jgi:hypothetical protein